MMPQAVSQAGAPVMLHRPAGSTKPAPRKQALQEEVAAGTSMEDGHRCGDSLCAWQGATASPSAQQQLPQSVRRLMSARTYGSSVSPLTVDFSQGEKMVVTAVSRPRRAGARERTHYCMLVEQPAPQH